MIDTLGLASPPLPEKLVRMIEQFCSLRQGFKLSTGEIEYSITTGKLEGTYDSAISIQVKRHRWTLDTLGLASDYKCINEKVPLKMDCEPYLYVECSVHKLMCGHNVFGGPDILHIACAFLVGFLEMIMEITLPEYKEWEVRRVDIAECYLMESFEQCQAWIHGLNNAEYPRRKVNKYGNEAIYSGGRSTAIKIYHKGPEFYKHDRRRLIKAGYGSFDYDIRTIRGKVGHLLRTQDAVSRLQDLANCIIRVEVEIKARKLRSDFGRDVKVHMIDDAYLSRVHDIEVERLLREGKSDMETVRNMVSVEQRLLEVYTKRRADYLLGFWSKLCLFGEAECKLQWTKSRFYANRKALEDAGVSWKGSDIYLAEYDLVPPEFKPLRGNIYHFPDLSLLVSEKMDTWKVS